jgi:sigma-B regulation protein RsbU (phosphoserine phosphatase)
MEQISVDGKASATLVRDAVLRNQLLSRRQRLRAAMPQAQTQKLAQLLEEVDSALERMDVGTYGICETCHEPIENERLMADPLSRNCLDHLSPSERRALERDLDLAFQVQQGLLPGTDRTIAGWNVAYCYEPAGPVSGDYCDLIALDGGTGVFMLGDVSGKGVAASMLMAQLHAIFRSLATVTRSVADLVAKANRIFCQGNPSSSFATLVCGHVDNHGNVEICNAGHCQPLHLTNGTVTCIESTSFPLGLFADGEYPTQRLKLAQGESLVLYTDGLSESFNESRKQYGAERLAGLLGRQVGLAPEKLLDLVLEDVKDFRGQTPQSDDLTIMVLRREV